MQEHVTPRVALRAAAAALAALACAPAVPAITLGDVEVKSALGEALDARIPVLAAPGDSLRGGCFTLSPDAASDLPAPLGATLELRRSAAGARLRVRTAEPVQDPALTLGILIACPGSDAAAARKDYSILLDPPRVQARAGTAAATPAIATLGARPGDTLASIAEKIYPRNVKARRAYLAAIRADNPALASLADDEPLPADAQVVLPDLRTFMKAVPAPRTGVAAREPAAEAPQASAAEKPPARAEAPARPRAKPRGAARAETPAPEALPSARSEAPALAAAEPERPAEPAPRASRSAESRTTEPRAGFQLKLSAPVVDLSPSRAMNESQREALRQRLLVLDSDDQTSAMLAMRDSIRRLESQVHELQLKLASPPPAVAMAPVPEPKVAAAAKPEPAAKPESAAKPEPAAKAEAPAKAEPAAKVPAPVAKSEPAVEAPAKPVSTATPEPAKAEPAPAPPAQAAPAPKPEPVAAAPSEPAPPKPQVTAKASEPAPSPAPAGAHAIPRSTSATPWYESQWMLPALLASVALLLTLWLVIRRRNAGEAEEEYYEMPADDQTVMIDEPVAREHEEEPLLPDDQVATQPEPSVPAPLLATTRIPPEDNADLRRRYLEERFPEIVNGTLVLSDPASVVNSARLMHEDGSATRAIELLQLAIETDPRPMAPWLALFEVFRLERLRGEYASLAVRFMERSNGTLEWRKVRQVGRDLDPGNPLYEDTEPALDFDPASENWLQAAPGGDAALAAELRGGLMAGAAVHETDLVPDPTPALRKSESFNVA